MQLRSKWPLGLLVAVLLVLALRWLAPLFLPLATTLVLTLLLSGPTERLQLRGVPASIAATSTVFLPAVLLGLVCWHAGPAAWKALGNAAASILQLAMPLSGRGDFIGAAARWAVDALNVDSDALSTRLGQAAVPAVLTTAVVLMSTFFLLLGQRSLLAGVLPALPTRRARVALVSTLVDARAGVARWLATSAVINLLLSAATCLALALVGFPDAGAWAGVIFGLLFIPYLGPLGIVMLLAAAGSGVPAGPLLPPFLFLALHTLEANFLNPWAMGRQLRVSRPLLLVAVQVGAFAWGVGGAVLAVPLLIVAHAALRALPGHALAKALLDAEMDDAPALRRSAESVRGRPARARAFERRGWSRDRRGSAAASSRASSAEPD